MVVFPTAPQVVADVQIADLRYNEFVLQAGRARVNYQGGRGSAQALLTRAFVADAIDRIGNDAVREAFAADADAWLEAAL